MKFWDIWDNGDTYLSKQFDERRISHLFILLMTFWLIIASVALLKAERKFFIEPDAFKYAAVAENILDHGVFSKERGAPVSPNPDRFFVPVYPAFLTGIFAISPELRSYVECARKDRKSDKCDKGIFTITIVQSALWALVPFLVFLMGRRLGLPITACLLACIILIFTTRGFSRFPPQMLTENIAVPLSTFACYLSLRLIDVGRMRDIALLGIVLGLLALTRPIFFYASPMIIAALVLLSLFCKSKTSLWSLQVFMIVSIACAFTISLWLIRNGLVFGDLALTEGYGARQFSKRVAYNAMTWTEFFANFIYNIPSWGGRAPTEALFPIEDFYRIIRGYPGAFYPDGGAQILQEAQTTLGHKPSVGDLIRLYVFPNLGGHLLSTIALTWQGIFVRTAIGLIGVIALPFWIWRIIVHGTPEQRMKWLAIVILPTVLIALHAAASVSIPRYNIPVAPIYALIAVAVFMSFKPKSASQN